MIAVTLYNREIFIDLVKMIIICMYGHTYNIHTYSLDPYIIRSSVLFCLTLMPPGKYPLVHSVPIAWLSSNLFVFRGIFKPAAGT